MHNERISSNQLTMLMISFILGSSLVLSSPNIGHDGWLPYLLANIETIPIVAVHIMLVTRFPNRTLVQIMEETDNPVLGKALASLYLLFLFQLGALVLRNFGDFFKAVSLPSTPLLVVISLFAVSCAAAASAGLESIARCSQVLLPIVVVVLLLTIPLLVPQYQVENFLPIARLPLRALITATHATTAFPFAEVVAFLMIYAALNKKSQLRSATYKAIILASILLVVATTRNIAVFGDQIDNVTFPSYSTLRQINLYQIFTRLEMLAGLNFIAMGFVKVAVLLYGTALGTAQLLGLREYKSLVPSLTALMILLAVIGHENMSGSIVFARQTWPVYAPFFQLGLPLLTLLIAIVRRRPQRQVT